jgi:crossover junction endodeoxyribonuclease RusA
MRLVLPMPPSINSQYATVNGRRVLSREAARWKRAAKTVVQQAVASGAISAAELTKLETAFIGLFIDWYFPTPLKRDLDGGLKITQDALCEALGINDNRVVDIHLIKRIDPLQPRIEVELEVIDDWQFDRQYVVLPAAEE